MNAFTIIICGLIVVLLAISANLGQGNIIRSGSFWSFLTGVTLICLIVYFSYPAHKFKDIENKADLPVVQQIIPYSVICLILYLWYLYERRKSYIYRKGVPGTATIVKTFKTGIAKGPYWRSIPQYEMVLDVNEGELVIYRAYATKFFHPEDSIPEIGTSIKVKVHPKDKYKLVIV